LVTLIGLIVTIGAISALLTLIPTKPVLVAGTAVAAATLNDAGSPSVARRGADVTIVEFSDYQCTPCKEGEADFERVVASDGRVRVIYKDWAALGPASKSEAEIALAAAGQGRYLAVHEAFMRSRARPAPYEAQALAIEAGADWPRLQADLVRYHSAIDSQLAKHAFEAWSLGLEGPPGYLVGPFLVRGRLTARDLRSLIARSRRR
jgi:protein-disulfide isomerase